MAFEYDWGGRMFQNDLLDLAIGLVFVWFILSLVISVINEGFVLFFRIRAKHLWLGIGRLVNPTDGKYARRLWDTVIRLPLSFKVFDLRPRAADESADSALGSPPRLPGDKPSGKPAVVAARDQRVVLQRIYDALAPSVTDVALAGRKSKLTKISGEIFSEAIASVAASVHPADLQNAAGDLGWVSARATALTTALNPFAADVVLDLAKTLGLDLGPDFEETEKRRLYIRASELFTARDVAGFFATNPELAQAVWKAAADLGGTAKVEAVKKTVEAWFDREMEQLSAMYRRQNRKILAILALPVVLIFQANTIGIVSDLRSDSALREAVVNQAIAVTAKDSLTGAVQVICPPPDVSSTSTSTPSPSPGTASDPVETSTTATSAVSTPNSGGSKNSDGAAAETPAASEAPVTTTTSTEPLEAAVERIDCAAQVIRTAAKFNLVPDLSDLRVYDTNKDDLSPSDLWHYEFVDWGWLGRIITLVALMFGAQFWFDVLRRLVGIRKFVRGSDQSVAG